MLSKNCYYSLIISVFYIFHNKIKGTKHLLCVFLGVLVFKKKKKKKFSRIVNKEARPNPLSPSLSTISLSFSHTVLFLFGRSGGSGKVCELLRGKLHPELFINLISS